MFRGISGLALIAVTGALTFSILTTMSRGASASLFASTRATTGAGPGWQINERSSEESEFEKATSLAFDSRPNTVLVSEAISVGDCGGAPAAIGSWQGAEAQSVAEALNDTGKAFWSTLENPPCPSFRKTATRFPRPAVVTTRSRAWSPLTSRARI